MTELPGREQMTELKCRHCGGTENIRVIWRIGDSGDRIPAAAECIDGSCPGRIPELITDPELLALVATHRRS